MIKKIFCIIIALIVMPSTAFAVGNMMIVGSKTRGSSACTDANPSGTCTGFAICQNWETTAEACDPCTEDNSESWDKTIGGTGTITVDYETALRGSQSIQILADGSNTTSIMSPSVTSMDTVYGFMRLKLADGRPASSSYVVYGYDDTTGAAFRIQISSTGYVTLYNGTSSINSTTQLPDGATGTYYIWWYWTKGTGTDGTYGIEVATDRTFVDWETEGTNGNANIQFYKISPRDRYIGGVVIDQLLIKSTAIGTVCD